ncbi:MAG: cation-translocating P-type ATPase C-terminal domain-containing protein, partial [Terrisporobacter sp.]
ATLTLSRIIQTFASRSNTESIFKLGFTSNKYALGAVIVCLGMFSLTLIPAMRGIFAIPTTYGLSSFATCFGLAVVASLAMEASKLIKK